MYMLKIKNLNDALTGTTFHSRGETWFIEPAHVSNGFNLMTGGIVKGYIIDGTKFHTAQGRPNVFGFVIDFQNETITLNIHRKGSGWTPLKEWTISHVSRDGRNSPFRFHMSSKSNFIKLISDNIQLDTVWNLYANRFSS